MSCKINSYAVLEYLYRDASNYKAHGVLLLTGTFSSEAKHALVRSLQDGEAFIPGQVHMQPLQRELYVYSNGPVDDDHPWHEFVDLRPATEEDVARLTPDRGLAEIVSQFSSIRCWNPDFSE